MNDDLDLILAAQSGDERAMTRLVAENRRFLAYVAQPYLRRAAPDDEKDILNAAALGLVTAVRKFDPSRDVKLSTFAWHHIRKEARDAALELNGVVTYRAPRSTKGSSRQFGPRHTSLDTPVGDGDMTFMDALPDDEAPDPDDAVMAAQLRDHIAHLPQRRRDVLAVIFDEDQPLRVAGERLGISRERARQIYESALDMLRARYADRAVEYDPRTA